MFMMMTKPCVVMVVTSGSMFLAINILLNLFSVSNQLSTDVYYRPTGHLLSASYISVISGAVYGILLYYSSSC